MEDYYTDLDHIFSEAASIYDKKILSNFININIRKIELRTLIKYTRGRNSILEIGCGTAEEASKFILETGKKVTCLEVSGGMIDFSTAKIRGLGISDNFMAVKGAASTIRSLGRSFDLIYSFNGALNTEPKIKEAADGIHDSLNHNGILIFSVRNRKCLGEILLYSILGKKENIKKRMEETTYVEVVGNKIRSTYYSPHEIRSIFKEFTLVKKKGLAIILPPYLAERVTSNFAKHLINLMGTLLSSMPLFSSLGDEILYVFKKE